MTVIVENLLGYSAEDIMRVLQRVFDETDENRKRALKLYDHMEQAMLNNKGDLIILSQMADHYLEQATRQTEILARLTQVMQKLNQFKPESGKIIMSDVNSLIEVLDKNQITPFTQVKLKKVVNENAPQIENVEL